jgi:hypothetical protein
MTAAHHAGTDRPARTYERTTEPVRVAAGVVGATFLLVGIAGFIPGITTNFDEIAGAGTASQAELFGIFRVSVAHNIVHLAFGLLGLVAAKTVPAARLFLIGCGLLYLGITLYGALIDLTSDANFLPFDDADNWLHLVLGVGMVALGLLLRSRDGEPARARR